jgi:SAM-dependent methyltransferase
VITLQKDEFERRKNEIKEKYGDWTAYDIKLGDNLYTMEKRYPFVKLKRIIQMIKDISGTKIDNLRILDLACLEGQYAIELALHGAKVVGIEGRESNIQKAIFAKEILSLTNLEFFQDDVRNLSKEKYGKFDIVLCCGILYHLDAPDCFRFLEQIYDVCERFAVIDTHISLSPIANNNYKGKTYWGRYFSEHDPNSSPEEKLKSNWASLDNVKSFWLTKPSLYNFLANIGFSSVYRCINPTQISMERDRLIIVAMKGEDVDLITSPMTNGYTEEWPEEQRLDVQVFQLEDLPEIKIKNLINEINLLKEENKKYREIIDNLRNS